MGEIEYVGFTDESYITDSRYRSIAMVSYDKESHTEFRDEIKRILAESSVGEFKWQKLKDARYRFCAQKMIDLIYTCYQKRNLRLDTIIWDTQDSRHRVQSRDDSANYERMFFHLVNNVLSRRTSPNAIWNIFPDEKNDIDWLTLNQCLENKGKKLARHSPFIEEICQSPWFYSIARFEQVSSEKCVQVQMSDLFSGLSVFSIASGNDYWTWQQSRAPSLFDLVERKVTNREENRFQILDHFISRASGERLSINFRKDKCLKTKYPNDFINFWHYIPQSFKDIAPTTSSHREPPVKDFFKE